MRRRSFVRSAFAAAALPALLPRMARAANAESEFAQLEATSGGRLCVFALDSSTGRRVVHRPHERFLFCSTFKLPLVGLVLRRVDAGQESLDRHVSFTKGDLQPYAPAARKNLGRGYMTIEQMCSAAIRLSDNTAANLLLASVGGPAQYTRALRALGDEKTVLTLYEPALNDPPAPGSIDNTTTPAAMGSNMRGLMLGTWLSPASRALLRGWLDASTTGLDLLRAGFPATWTVGDKTGMGGRHNRYGDNDTRNDIAFVVPPGRAPWIVAAFLTGAQLPAEARDATLASVARIVTRALQA